MKLKTIYACRATTVDGLWVFEKEPKSVSPNRQSQVEFKKNFAIVVKSKGHEIGKVRIPDLSGGMEISWSPDSRGFFITYSDGGAIGGYHLRVFEVTDQLNELPASRIAEDEFKSKHYCKPRGNNALGLKWNGSFDRLTLVTEVYPTSDCGREMGTYRGYEVETRTGRIIERFSEKQVDNLKQCENQ